MGTLNLLISCNICRYFICGYCCNFLLSCCEADCNSQEKSDQNERVMQQDTTDLLRKTEKHLATLSKQLIAVKPRKPYYDLYHHLIFFITI